MEKNYNYNYENRSQGQKLPIGYSNLGVSSCTSKVLDKSPVTNGSLWHTTDKNEFYYDWNGKRIKLNLTGNNAEVLAEIDKIKEEIKNLDPGAVKEIVKELETNVNGAVKDAQKAAQVAQNAANQVENKADVSYVDTTVTNAIAGKADASKVDDLEVALGNKADVDIVNKLSETVDGLETTLTEKANSADVESAINTAVADKVSQDVFNELKDTVEAIEIPTKVSKFENDAKYITRLEIESDLLTSEDRAALNAIKDLGASDVETGKFPVVDLDGLATVQDVMNYVNTLIEKKKGELTPIEPGTPYAYITGYALDGTSTDITMFNQFELNKSGDTELEIWSAKEIGSYDESGKELSSIKLTVDIPSDYSIKESYQWNTITSTYVLIEDGLFEKNPRYVSRTINGVVYNSYARKASSQISIRDNTRYKIIITK